MQKRGKTAAGTQRWYCTFCEESSTKRRPDHQERSKEKLFKQWLTGNATLGEIARSQGVSVRTLQDWFRSCWQRPCAAILKQPADILVLDATGMSRECVLLVVLNTETNAPVAWYSAVRETYLTWKPLLGAIPYTPMHLVCDGHQGLAKAAKERWPDILIQRCHAHVLREMRGFLTLNPKLPAGIALRILVEEMKLIQTRRQKRRWVRKVFAWDRKYKHFLKEKTKTLEGHWRYTHRRLRRARSHLFNALPDLFRYIKNSRVPKTSNQLEGGINSPIKDLARKHRGLVTYKKLVLASLYLKKRGEKPPRRFL